ncbi:hypothetical protein ACFCZT_07830 [Streptomyces sp. NPDC056230]|uniref:hypothetical protein n=1 Tax=Streptomyces sp. NPDC056230 TaxID=3345754 RepID=UPI0035DB1EFE
MRVHRTTHKEHFTVMPNSILRHPRLSLTARGLLGTLLSLPDGSEETVESLSGKVEEGRERVRKAMTQLETEGFIRRVRRQREGGLWSTVLHVSDVPMGDAVPNDRFPTVGEPSSRAVGRSPKGERNLEKETPLAPVDEKAPERPFEPQKGAEEAPQQQEAQSAPVGRAAAFLGRLGAHEPKLSLSAHQTLELAPLAAEWFNRGASDLEARLALSAGLPEKVHSARAILAHRLVALLPEQRSNIDPVAPAVAVRTDCTGCDRPMPLGATTDICADCTGTTKPRREGDEEAAARDWRLKPAGAVNPSAGRAKMRALMANA